MTAAEIQTKNSGFDGKAYARTLTEKPGTYRMLDGTNKVIYVGKARNLRNRVGSYFQPGKQHSPKTRALVAQISAIEITVTHTESEALLLENNLIKELKPRYNVVLRDDKSYPYIYLSSDQDYPRLSFHRGARKGKGRYFGPYPSAGAVRASLNLLQKLFLIRPCEDSYFRNRSRPCLQYQIDRCTAPCVSLIDSSAYRLDVEHAVMFLDGKNQEVIDLLVKRMQQASQQLDFERAARYRDQITALQRVQQKQYISSSAGELDIVACKSKNGLGCVQVFFIRGGHNLGNKAFFPHHTRDLDETEIMAAFLPQYYLARQRDRALPNEILINQNVTDLAPLIAVLSQRQGRNVPIQHEVRGERARWLKMAEENAVLALEQRQLSNTNQVKRLLSLRKSLNIAEAIQRIECFDISHTRGEATVASCVVFGANGPIKSEYRRFNIDNIEPGDDYAAMRQAVSRRYTRVKEELGKVPELLLIDGGKGQVTQAKEVLESLQLQEIKIIGVAKGPTRKAGLETLILSDGSDAPNLAADSTALHLVQQVRDEAHRFAVAGHRQRRAKARTRSTLEDIEGVGRKRRQSLIQHFGGIPNITKAGVEDLANVPGISRQLAARIYDTFHTS